MEDYLWYDILNNKYLGQIDVHLNKEHFMQTKYVFPGGARHVPHITLFNVESFKPNRFYVLLQQRVQVFDNGC